MFFFIAITSCFILSLLNEPCVTFPSFSYFKFETFRGSTLLLCA